MNIAPQNIEALMNDIVMPALNARLSSENADAEAVAYYYNDISRQEQTGQTIAYPCIFRLLRTETEYQNGRFADNFVYKEAFVFCEKAHTDPGIGTEEPMEQRLLHRVHIFNTIMASVPGIVYTPPTLLRWWRRDNADYALLVSFDCRLQLQTSNC